jgi:hypothetical protein
MRLPAIAALFVLCASVARADIIVETGSGQEFRTRISHRSPVSGETVELRATGTALRKKRWHKLYAACFYIRADAKPGRNPYASFIAGDYEKLLVLRFLRAMDAGQLADDCRERMLELLPAAQAAALAAFLALFAGPFAAGQELSFSAASAQELAVYRDGHHLGEVEDQAVVAAFWATWFGEHPLNEDVKQGLAGY